jgi:hypothetical protein
MKLPIGFEIIDDAVDGCEQFIEWLDLQEWSRSTVFEGTEELKHSANRTSDSIAVPFLSYAIPDFVARINRTVYAHMDSYASAWSFPFYDIEPVSVQRYKAAEQQRYDVHVDAGFNVPRVLSALLYLNDCDGGETYFPHFEFGVQPRAGRLALFPSNFIYAHEARPPASGVKYAAAYWARG